MQKNNNLQEIFLTKARKQSIPLTIFLMNGFQLRGVVTGFDCFTVVLDTDGKQQIIYKHAISTIVPIHPVSRRRNPACRRTSEASQHSTKEEP
ncbi:MAG: RNA chaperone Hfq [Oscillospiraceae bacterium]